MEAGFALETPIWEIVLRASVVYLGLAAVLRIVPKRQTGSLAPNDILALVVIGSIAASAILGAATSTLDLMLKILVIVIWDYLFNLAEYHWRWFRRVAQDSPTLLVHEGQVLEANLRRESSPSRNSPPPCASAASPILARCARRCWRWTAGSA